MSTGDQLNVLRYASGFIPYKLLQKYEVKPGEDRVSRGGLFSICNEAFSLFIVIERLLLSRDLFTNSFLVT